MANKIENETQVVKKTNEFLVLQAKRVLNKSEFTLLSDLVRNEQEKSGVKIVLMPNSVEIIEPDTEEKTNEEDEAKAKEEAEAKAKAEEEAEAKAKAEEKKKTEAKAKSEKTDK